MTLSEYCRLFFFFLLFFTNSPVKLKDAPQDLISSVRFAPAGPILLTTSWDAQVRIYDARQDHGTLHSQITYKAPLLDACWDRTSGNSTAYVAGFERRVYALDVEQGKTTPIGRDHNRAIKAVVHHSESRSVISGSFDKTLQQTDTRTPAGESQIFQLPGKVFAMDSTDRHLVVGMSERLVHVYDLRNLRGGPLQQNESSLKYPTRTLRCIPNDVGYVNTSIEGRVAVEYFNLPGTPQHEKYAFKCHRIVDKSPNSVDTVTPVNAIAFHPTYGTFFSGGSDAVVCLWDFQARKRMKQYPRFPASVMALDVDSTGTMLAVGVSDDAYKENPIELGPAPKASAVFVRYLGSDEARGKT